MIPYLYTLLFESSRNGSPIIRPMVYMFCNDPKCHNESFDFMLGPNILVASVFEASHRERSVYLPKYNNWCDFHSGKWYQGGQVCFSQI